MQQKPAQAQSRERGQPRLFEGELMNAAMPIRSPIGDLGPLGDFLVKIGPLLVPFYTKSPLFQICKYKKVL